MGKGKAKGFRPPRPDDPSAGLLLGSAAHCTGDTVASPVQLREEGRALPQGHLNFGDEWGKGGGKGDGPTGANGIPVAPKAAFVPARPKGASPAAPSKEEAKEEVKAEASISSSSSSSAALKASAKAAVTPSAPSRPVASAKPTGHDGLSEIERRRATLTDIERRRAAMLERERASQTEAREVTAESEASQGPCKEEAQEEDDQAAGYVAVKEEVEEEVEEEEEDEVARAAARRRRLEVQDGGAEDDEEKPDVKRLRTDDGGEGKPQPQTQRGAMKQGLQEWAALVNALAKPEDVDLAQRCRDFVRQRILRAHAEGNLHAVDWGEEAVPAADELLAADAS